MLAIYCTHPFTFLFRTWDIKTLFVAHHVGSINLVAFEAVTEEQQTHTGKVKTVDDRPENTVCVFNRAKQGCVEKTATCRPKLNISISRKHEISFNCFLYGLILTFNYVYKFSNKV